MHHYESKQIVGGIKIIEINHELINESKKVERLMLAKLLITDRNSYLGGVS